MTSGLCIFVWKYFSTVTHSHLVTILSPKNGWQCLETFVLELHWETLCCCHLVGDVSRDAIKNILQCTEKFSYQRTIWLKMSKLLSFGSTTLEFCQDWECPKKARAIYFAHSSTFKWEPQKIILHLCKVWWGLKGNFRWNNITFGGPQLHTV
jgi:hypothetical protein